MGVEEVAGSFAQVDSTSEDQLIEGVFDGDDGVI